MGYNIHIPLCTAIAILCSLLTRSQNDRRTELYSQILCWSILLATTAIKRCIRARPRLEDTPIYNTKTSKCLWLIASGVMVSSICRAEAEIRWILPSLVPLMIGFQYHYSFETLTETKSHPDLSSFSHSSIYVAAGVAVFTLFSRFIPDLITVFYGNVTILASLAIFATLHTLSVDGYSISSAPFLEDIFLHLSWRVLCLLIAAVGFQAEVFGLPSYAILPIVRNGLIRAVIWMALLEITPSTTWITATTIETFIIVSDTGSITQSSAPWALLHVVISALPLQHTLSPIPRSSNGRSAIWIIWLGVLTSWAFREATIVINSSPYLSYSTTSIKHPIESIIRNANQEFDKLVKNQSHNYDQAQREYSRRYGIEPPPGFKEWVEFAIFHKSPIIDEFDTLHQATQPFFNISGQDVVRLMKDAHSAPGNDLWRCSFDTRHSKSRCRHDWRTSDRHISRSFKTLMKEIKTQIPRVELLVNHLDEPSVLIQPQPDTRRVSQRSTPPEWRDLSNQPIWSKITEHCAKDRIELRKSNITHPRFVEDVTSSNDLCLHPEFEKQHGFFMSPASMRLIEVPIPILSTGAPSTMGDILFPSPAYSAPEFQYSESSDIDWDMKDNKLYWAGSTTGGHAWGSYWHDFQRQRFVTLAQNIEDRSHQYLKIENNVTKPQSSQFFNTRLYDVRMTQIVQCHKKECSDQNAYFRKDGWIHRHRSLKARFVFDIDGNGISGRFYQFLASKSTPLKQTIFREWHDDRLIPWVHYIPVSLGMEELPELQSYLALSEMGQKRAKEVADQGRDWYFKAFREIDRSIYLYRLLLELARLQDPKRKAGEL